jgi:cytochrome c biogenesis protein CcmG, thiol:disulfide interchange protein DsbE
MLKPWQRWTPGQKLTVLALAPLAVLLLGLLGSSLAGSPRPASAASEPGIGFTRLDRAAPGVRLPGLVGRAPVGLADLTGKPIVVNFWSSTCDICAAETRALVQVANSTRGRVNFLGIDSLDSRAAGTAFAARYRIPYQSGFDPGELTGARYGVYGLPMTFFLSPSGKRILGVNVGGLTQRSLTGILHSLYGAV